MATTKTETFTQACSKVGNFSYYNNFTLYVQLTNRDGSSATNKSWVDYKVYCSSNGSGSLDSKHAIYFAINGEEKVNKIVTWTASSPYISITIAEGSFQIDHNPDGNKTISFSASIKASSYGVSASKSGEFALEKIPRYTTVSNSERWRTVNTISINWSTADARDHTQYSLNGGAWTDAGDTVASDNKSGYYTIYDLVPDTTYTIKTRCKRADSQLWSEASTLTIATYDIARLAREIPNVNIGSSHTIQWTNPAGATTTLKLCQTNNSQIIDYGTVTGTSKTVTPTASKIYPLTPNSNTVMLRYILTTTQNGESYTSHRDCYFYVTDSNPTFSNFTYVDTNTDKLVGKLTNANGQTIVKGYSNVKGIVSVANKATAKNSATMSKYRLSIGEKTAEVAYSSSAEVSTTINAVQSNSFTMYAIDSRGNSTGKTITAATYINYSPIKITSINLIRTNSVTSETTLKFSGSIWNGNFGLADNAITSCSYRYKKTTDSSWTTGETTITPTKSGGTFSFTGIIKGDLGANGFDIDNSYNIQVLVADKLSNNHSNPASFILGPGTPAMAIYKNNVALGQRYSTNEGGKLQVNGASILKGRVSLKHSPVNFGGCRDVTIVDSYVKLFTLTMTSRWKSNSIWFTLTDTQNSNENLLCSLYVYRGETSTSVRGFNYLTTKSGFEVSRLVAVVTSENTTDVYYKMVTNDSPTITILSQTKMFEEDSCGKITIDCLTTTTSLPSGTQTTPKGIIMGQKSRTTNGDCGYGTNNEFLVDVSMLAYWNGGYNGAGNSNLIHCMEGKIQAKPTTLYNNSEGTTGTVTLSQTSANFVFIEIFFRDDNNGGVVQSVRCASPDGAKAQMQILSQSETDIRHNVQRATISGTSITKTLGQVNYMGGGRYTVNEIKIIKVVGWK